MKKIGILEIIFGNNKLVKLLFSNFTSTYIPKTTQQPINTIVF